VIPISGRQLASIDLHLGGVDGQCADFRGNMSRFSRMTGRLEAGLLHFSPLNMARAPSSGPRNALWRPLPGLRIRELADEVLLDGKFRPSSPLL
jgi:hypothetical protein